MSNPENSPSLLLDTHTFVWWSTGSPELPDATVDLIVNAPIVCVSLVSLWEIVLKEGTSRPMIGTADAERWFAEAMAATDFKLLPIEARHIGAVQLLEPHHRDPFDRLLIAQAKLLGHAVVTRDRAFADYGIGVLWPVS
jgi:PIN domain nuclease of toxin-antitoxin system